MLRDTDELAERMQRPENEERMGQSRQNLEQTRENIRRTTEALRQGQISQAVAERHAPRTSAGPDAGRVP